MTACLSKFRVFLVDEHGFTDLYAGDKAWAAKYYFLSKAERDGASERMKREAASCRAYFEEFTRKPDFRFTVAGSKHGKSAPAKRNMAAASNRLGSGKRKQDGVGKTKGPSVVLPVSGKRKPNDSSTASNASPGVLRKACKQTSCEGCPKCRHRSGGCSECNPKGFTIEERCRRERHHHSEDCLARFEDYYPLAFYHPLSCIVRSTT